MFISGTLGTVIGDFCSHNMRLDDAGASILLSPIEAVLFLAGRGGGFSRCRFIDSLKTVTNGGYGFDHFRHRERSCHNTPLHRPTRFPDTVCSS